MENTTKSRILEEALVMFAENGYKGSNLRDLAQRLGLSKSALYRHFESKEDIWNSLIDTMSEYYDDHFGSEEKLPAVPDSCEELAALTMRMVDFTVNDRSIILLRKLIASEQFRDEKVTPLATKHFLTGTEHMFAYLFKEMMGKKLLKENDPDILALEFTAPITALIHLCDREPDRKSEATERIRSFVIHFISTYSTEGV